MKYSNLRHYAVGALSRPEVSNIIGAVTKAVKRTFMVYLVIIFGSVLRVIGGILYELGLISAGRR